MHFQRIKDLRTDAELNQDVVADHLHMQRTVYSRYERGEREAPSWMIVALADYYNTTTDYILGISRERGTDRMYFQRLKELREAAGKSQEEIAKHLGIHRNTYNSYESGKREVPAWVIHELAVFYKKSADDILGVKTKDDEK